MNLVSKCKRMGRTNAVASVVKGEIYYISCSRKTIYTNISLLIISLLLVFKERENILVLIRQVISEMQFLCPILRA